MGDNTTLNSGSGGDVIATDDIRRRISSVDIAWMAGIVEGEGWIGHDKRSLSPKIKVHMTDEDVIRRLHFLSGVGRVSKPIILPSGKPSWTWRVERPDHAAGLLMTLATFLGKRRFAKAKATLEIWKNNGRLGSRARRVLCIRGHSLIDGNNLVALEKGGRRCKLCHRMRQKAYGG